MLDPGTALAVVGLAITVCQELQTYYDGYKQYDEDVASVRSTAASLGAIFGLVSDALAQTELSQKQLQTLVNCISECEDNVTKMEKKLKKIKLEDDPKTISKAFKAGLLRVLYPFKKDTLDKLHSTSQALIQRLMLAMDTLQLTMGAKLAVELDRLKAQMQANDADLAKNMEALHINQDKTLDGVQFLVTAEEDSKLRDVLAWLSAPDPYTNHNDARAKHQAGTGLWFLTSPQYVAWVEARRPCLWVHGKAGCCKTVLSSTIIEDVNRRVGSDPNTGFAFFYFTFSDQQKQTYRSLLLSLVTQLSNNYPLDEALRKAYDDRAQPPTATLEATLLRLVGRRKHTYVIIDALDESPEGLDKRQEVLDGLGRLTSQLEHLSLLIASRPESDIRDSIARWPGVAVAIDEKSVDADIRLYVERQLDVLPRLKTLPLAVKEEIIATFEEKADGM